MGEVPMTTILDPTSEDEGPSLRFHATSRGTMGLLLLLKDDGTYEMPSTYAEMIEAGHPFVAALGRALQDAYDKGYEEGRDSRLEFGGDV